MLPLPKALASPKNTQIPAPGQQDGAPEPPIPGDTEACRLRFRQFQYRVAGGPHHALGHLWMLLRQWLRPEAHSKEQIMELLVLEQFLGALPSKMRTWVQSQGPRTCKEAATLVEDLIEMSQQEGEGSGLTPKSKWFPGGAGVGFGFWPISPWVSAQGSRYFFLWDSECLVYPALLPPTPHLLLSCSLSPPAAPQAIRASPCLYMSYLCTWSYHTPVFSFVLHKCHCAARLCPPHFSHSVSSRGFLHLTMCPSGLWLCTCLPLPQKDPRSWPT